jgi:two-component system sensor histidine kinase KdpD
MLSNTLTLAQQLGATVFTYKGDDIVKTILQFAREYRVGHIVIGTPGKKLPFWRRLSGEVSIMERLVTEGTGITVVVLDTKAIRKDPLKAELFHPAGQSHHIDAERRNLSIRNELIQSDRCILIWDAAIEKEEAMRRLLEACYNESAGQKESAWKALLEREELGGTFVGQDVAIPHARIVNLHRPLVALGFSRAGIPESESGRSVRIMLLLLSPADSPERHLRVLGEISRMARDDLWRKAVLSARKSSDIMEVLREWEGRFSASCK